MSSGTTGLPKAAQISHYNCIAQQRIGFEAAKRPFDVRRILCLPQYATAAIFSNHICPPRCGDVCFVMPRFNTTDYINNIERFEISHLSLLPPIIVSVLNSPLCKASKFRSVQMAQGGGAPISRSLQMRLQALLPAGTPMTQGWGMTETCGPATGFHYPEQDGTASIGRLLPNLQAKLIDDHGHEVEGYNKRGELCIRGPTVMMGYLSSDPNSLALAIDENGWLRTGDICCCDEKTQKWYIVDRKKELIKAQEFQVPPAELESILFTHPDIGDNAVVGVDSPSGGTEIPVAFVVPKTGATHLTERDVVAFVDKQIISYKRLQGGVHFVESIPKSPSGKVLKNELREKARLAVRVTGSKL